MVFGLRRSNNPIKKKAAPDKNATTIQRSVKCSLIRDLYKMKDCYAYDLQLWKRECRILRVY